MTVKEFKVQYALGSLSTDNLNKLAKNKRTAKTILTILSTNENITVKCKVAANLNTPAKALENIYRATEKLPSNMSGRGSLIRYGIATNPSTPISLLEKLASMDHDGGWDMFRVGDAAERTLKKINKD